MQTLKLLAVLAIALAAFVAGSAAGVVSATNSQPKEVTMPSPNLSVTAFSVTLSGATKNADGSWLLRWGDGVSEYPVSIADYLNEPTSELQSLTTARRLLIWWWFARDDDFSNTNLVVGKTLIFDLSAANPIRVQ